MKKLIGSILLSAVIIAAGCTLYGCLDDFEEWDDFDDYGSYDDYGGPDGYGNNGYGNDGYGYGYDDNSGYGYSDSEYDEYGNFEDFGSGIVSWIGSMLSYDEEEYDASGSENSESDAEIQAEMTQELKTGATNTIMVYMIGSNLESDGGCASADLTEMMKADLGDQVNIVVETGGAKSWSNRNISSSKIDRFAIENNKLVLKDELNRTSMVESSTLSSFIKWAAENYPAERYMLILWDHGGGTMCGYGGDEYYEDDLLELDELASALKSGGVEFGFIGFDACLMATLETAYAVSPYADYLIASEETEPGDGWYYTKWLNYLSSNPTADTATIGKTVVNSFVDNASFWDDTTLAVIDLSKISSVYSTMADYLSSNTSSVATTSGYKSLTQSLSRAKSYGDGEYDQIDIVDFVNKNGGTYASSVVSAVNDCVVYHDGSVSDSNGLAMYFPYQYPSYYSSVLKVMKNIGMTDSDYNNFFSTFLSAYSGGHSYGSYRSSTSNAAEEEDVSDETWYDSSTAETFENADVLPEVLELTENSDGDFILELTDEEWEYVTGIELSVMYYDGEGYLDLGSDNSFDFDDDGNLICEYDYTWIALNGVIVPFYYEYDGYKNDGTWYTYGYVPAILNGEEYIDILIYWDDNQLTEGTVLGYRESSDGPSLSAKNYLQFHVGDTLEFLCDYYTTDLEYEDTYTLTETLTLTQDGLTVSYEPIEYAETVVWYYITDIYNNVHVTESIMYQ